MSTNFNVILANDAAVKANLIVDKAISKGVRGVDGLKVVENTGDTSLKVKILAGTYIYDPSFIIWSDTDLVVDGFTAAVSERYDIAYLDVVTDTQIPAPDGGNVVKIAEDAASVPTAPDGHAYVGLWKIRRPAGTAIPQSAITFINESQANSASLVGPIVAGYIVYVDGDGLGDFVGHNYEYALRNQANDGWLFSLQHPYDLRIIPSEIMHTHNLVAGAVDVTASASEINQALDGITPDVTAARLSELSGSDPTGAQLDELVAGAATALHSHNSTNSIQTPAGTASPVAGVLNITQSGQAQVTAAGDTINIHLESDNLGNHTATQDLNMAGWAVDGIVMSIQNALIDFPVLPPGFPDPDPAKMEATNKRYVDNAVAGALGGFAKYNAEQDFDLNPTGGAATHKKIANLKDGAASKDAINKGQLDAATTALGGSLANLDDRYKIGNPNGSSTPADPNYHVNKKAWGNLDLSDYKIENSGAINKVTDAPKTLVNKQYVDEEIAEAIEDLEAQINGFFKNPAETDLNMTGPNGQKTIVALKNPISPDQAANKAYVDFVRDYVISLIPTIPGQQPDGDNLGDHTATMDLLMEDHRIVGLVMQGQNADDMTPNDKQAINRKYLVDALKGILDDEDVPPVDLTGFAKIGTDVSVNKNVLPLTMAVNEGGEVNVRGTDGKGLLVIKKKANDAPGEDVFINSRIQGVEDPVEDQDAVNFRTLKKWAVKGDPQGPSTTLEFEVSVTNAAYPGNVTFRTNFSTVATLEKISFTPVEGTMTGGVSPSMLGASGNTLNYMYHVPFINPTAGGYSNQAIYFPTFGFNTGNGSYAWTRYYNQALAPAARLFTFFVPFRLTIKSEYKSLFKGLKYNSSVIYKDGSPLSVGNSPTQIQPSVLFPYKLFPSSENPGSVISKYTTDAATVSNGAYPRNSSLSDDSSSSYPITKFVFADDCTIFMFVAPWLSYQAVSTNGIYAFSPYVGKIVFQLKPDEPTSTEWWRS